MVSLLLIGAPQRSILLSSVIGFIADRLAGLKSRISVLLRRNWKSDISGDE
jgi:hypothetical protein